MAEKGFSVKLDMRRLEKLEREFPGRADEAVAKMAFDFQADVVDSFSKESPSPEGQPPGVVTGFLKNSIYTKKIRERLYEVRAGAEYAVHLEFGTSRMAARPFWRPALARIVGKIPAYFKAVVK